MPDEGISIELGNCQQSHPIDRVVLYVMLKKRVVGKESSRSHNPI